MRVPELANTLSFLSQIFTRTAFFRRVARLTVTTQAPVMQPGPTSSPERRIANVSECTRTDQTVSTRARRVAGSSAPSVEVRSEAPLNSSPNRILSRQRTPLLPGWNPARASLTRDSFIDDRTSACVSVAVAVTRRVHVEHTRARRTQLWTPQRSPCYPIPHQGRFSIKNRSAGFFPSESASFPSAASSTASPTRTR